jgi:hypothetical protein
MLRLLSLEALEIGYDRYLLVDESETASFSSESGLEPPFSMNNGLRGRSDCIAVAVELNRSGVE